MENASKALVMAAGVLIAIAIISIAVYFYSNMKGYASSQNDMLLASQVQSFNRFYTAFRSSDNKIRVVDALNLLNRAVEDEIEADCSSTVSSIKMENGLYKVNTSKSLLDSVYFKLYYDVQGRVNKVSISDSAF